jgi:NAD(P)-dependent dehydrogenase (short-subunit alcohol dehydrogenase family)
MSESDVGKTAKGSAVITGAAQGIGRAIAIQLARDGYAILVNDIPSKQAALDGLVGELRDAGGRASAAAGDVSVEDDVQRMIQVAISELGPLEVVSSFVRRRVSVDGPEWQFVSNAGVAQNNPILSSRFSSS